MSRKNPMASSNPTERYFEWDGDKGHIYWYDKENKKQVKEPFPFMFLYLEQLYRITGWSDADNCSIYSNEIADTQKQEFVVKLNDGGEIARGKYSNISDKVKGRGGKFTASIYLVYMDELGEPKIGNLKLKGAGISNWFDFCKEVGEGLVNKGVIVYESEQDTKGNVTYQKPVFGLKSVKEKSVAIADEMYEKIQPYIEEKSKVVSPQPQHEHQAEPANEGTDYPDDQPRANTNRSQRKPQEKSQQKADSESDEDFPFDDYDDDLPF